MSACVTDESPASLPLYELSLSQFFNAIVTYEIKLLPNIVA